MVKNKLTFLPYEKRKHYPAKFDMEKPEEKVTFDAVRKNPSRAAEFVAQPSPEELDRNFVKKYIEQVTVTLLDDGQAEISLTMKTDEWKQILSRIEVEGTDSGTKE